jgi:hypothetical protein
MAIEESDMESTRGPLIALETGGLLVLQDKVFPNVVTIVTGESLGSSWWSHPRSHEIFRWANELADDADVVVAKLLDGKVTFIHRRLWPALLAVANGRESWQTAGLSRDGRALFDRVECAEGVLTSGPASTELQRRLLVHGEQVHTETGRHRTRLESWKAWALRTGCKPIGSAALGRALLEEVAGKLGGSARRFPWHRFRVKSTTREPEERGASPDL